MLMRLKLGVALASIAGAVVAFATNEARPLAANDAKLASPRSLYIQNCARCHGANGKAQTARGRKLEAADLTSADVQGMSSARITRTIKNGRPGMPAFGKKLTPQQIASVTSYVRLF